MCIINIQNTMCLYYTYKIQCVYIENTVCEQNARIYHINCLHFNGAHLPLDLYHAIHGTSIEYTFHIQVLAQPTTKKVSFTCLCVYVDACVCVSVSVWCV